MPPVTLDDTSGFGSLSSKVSSAIAFHIQLDHILKIYISIGN